MQLSGAMYARVGVGVVVLCAGALACYELVSGDDAAKDWDGEHPNVLIIMWDTVRADRLSAYGYDRPTTPFLEELAKEATLYEYAISPGTWTLPSHASLFTGLPASAHGATAFHKWVDGDLPRLSEILSANGYETYMFSSNPFISDVTNLDAGFAKVDYVWEVPWAEKTLRHTIGKMDPRDKSTEFANRVRAKRSRMSVGEMALSSGDLTQSGPVIAEAFEKWLDGRDESKPFFAFLNYMEAHFPRIPSMEARRKVMRPDLIDASLAVDQDHARLMSYMFGQEPFSEHELAVINGVYDASLVDLDATTHDLVERVRQRGILDDTVVVIVSDHGENLGDHELMGHKYSVHNSLSHVPLIIRFPARLRPQRVAAPVSVLDMYATLLDLAQVNDPASSPLSRSLLDTSSEGGPSSTPVCEMLAPATTALQFASKRHPDLNWNPWMRTYRAIEVDGAKLIWSSDGRHKLYDMRRDPGERNNLLVESPGSAEPLQSALDSWLGSFPHYDDYRDRPSAARPMSPEEMERLKALGYGGDESAPEREN